MPGLIGGRVRVRFVAVGVAVLAFGLAAIWAAPAGAIMVKLPRGGYANYDPISGSKAPKAAKIFDAAFTNLDYSGGPVMPSNTNYSIVWKPSNYSGTAFPTGYEAGVDQFFTDMAADSGSSGNSDAVSTQYNDVSGNTAAYNFQNGGQFVDTDPLPNNGCPANPGDICLSDTQLQAELNAFLASKHLPADLRHEYFLLTPPDVASCVDSAGSACSGNADQNLAYCAYHSETSGGYLYSNIPDLAGLDGCDPYASNWFNCPNFSCSYNNGPVDGVLSAISHEHNESITDPQPNNAWTDWGSNVGGEIGDKCNNDAFSDPNLQFGGINSDQPFNETINGDSYLIQREWSNQTASCLDGFIPNGTTAHAAFTYSLGAGNAVNFNAGGSIATGGGVAEYVWQFNDGPGQTGTIETSSPTITHTFPAAGNYTVALTVMSLDGTSNGTANAITAGAQPLSASFSAPSGVAGSALSFDGRASSDPNLGDSITSYAWNFGDGVTGGGAVAQHTYAHPGSYTATLTVSDGFQSASTSRTVTVTPDETPSASFTSPGSGFTGRAIAFSGAGSDSDGFIATYAWNFGDGGTASGSSVSHTYSSPGTYTVTLTVLDSSGLSATASHQVTVGRLHGPNHGPSCVVPKLKGKTLSQARTALSKAHCGVGKIKQPKKPKHGAGAHKTWELVVAHQSIPAGRTQSQGTKVGLTLVYKAVKVVKSHH